MGSGRWSAEADAAHFAAQAERARRTRRRVLLAVFGPLFVLSAAVGSCIAIDRARAQERERRLREDFAAIDEGRFDAGFASVPPSGRQPPAPPLEHATPAVAERVHLSREILVFDTKEHLSAATSAVARKDSATFASLADAYGQRIPAGAEVEVVERGWTAASSMRVRSIAHGVQGYIYADMLTAASTP